MKFQPLFDNSMRSRLSLNKCGFFCLLFHFLLPPSFKQGEPGDQGSPGPLEFHKENDVRGKGTVWGSGSSYVHRVMIQKRKSL